MKKTGRIGVGLIVILSSVALFSFFKKTPTKPAPYKNRGINLIYNLLFCDSLELFKANTQKPHIYPFDVLFSNASGITDLQKIMDDQNAESRLKVLACNKLLSKGHKPVKKELFGVIIEVALDEGLDVLASYSDGTARYINYTEKMVVWEASDETSSRLTKDLFAKSLEIVNNIGSWDKPRKPFPAKGMARITFLVSDGLYFGEGPIDAMFTDPFSSPALTTGAELMKYLTEKALDSQKR